MAKEKPGTIEIKAFADHHVITQPNPLRKVLRRVAEEDLDDPVARAEEALAGLSGEFKNWMAIEADRLSTAHATILKDGFTDATCEELFRAAHDIKGDAAQPPAQFGSHADGVELGALAHDRLNGVDMMRDQLRRHLVEIGRVLDDPAQAFGGGAGGRVSECSGVALDVVSGAEQLVARGVGKTILENGGMGGR